MWMTLLGNCAKLGAGIATSRHSATAMRRRVPGILFLPSFCFAAALCDAIQPRQFEGGEMILQDLWHVLGRMPPETAIGREAKLPYEFPNDRQTLLKARHAVDHAEIDARTFHVDIG